MFGEVALEEGSSGVMVEMGEDHLKSKGKGDSGHGGCGSIRQLAGVSTVWECACILCIPAASMQCSRSPSVSQKRRTRMQTRN